MTRDNWHALDWLEDEDPYNLNLRAVQGAWDICECGKLKEAAKASCGSHEATSAYLNRPMRSEAEVRALFEERRKTYG